MRALVFIALVCAATVHALDSHKQSQGRLHADSETTTSAKRSLAGVTRAELDAAMNKAAMRIARAVASYDGFEHQETAHLPSGAGTFATGSTVNRHPLPLPLPDKNNVKTTDDRFLPFGESLLGFGEITAIAGDYMGVKTAAGIVCDSDHTISLSPRGTIAPRTAEKRGERYQAAFDDFKANTYYKKGSDLSIVVEQIRKMIAKEEAEVAAAEAKYAQENNGAVDPKLSTNAYKAYYAKDWFTTKVVHVETISRRQAWYEGFSGFQDMVMNLKVNDDHFGDGCAQMTYAAGHDVAKRFAKTAAEKIANNDIAGATEAMILAYSHEAFVSHFLTDLFSAGHVRGPRRYLKPFCTGSVEGMPGAGLTANLQHDEDGANCLLVTNLRKQIFWTCGDEKFFDRVNYAARKVVRAALEAGINDLVDIMNAKTTDLTAATALELIPSMDFSKLGTNAEWADRLRLENTCPRFIIDPVAHTMTMRRNTDLTNPRTPYAINHGFPTSKATAETATDPWTENDLATVFGSKTLTPDLHASGGDAITCKYWPYVNYGNNAYCCAAPPRGSRAVVTVVPNAPTPTVTNTCTSGGFAPEKAVDNEFVNIYA